MGALEYGLAETSKIRAIIAALALCVVPVLPSRGAEMIQVKIDIHDEKQVMHSFGASDCWTCQFVGENWPLESRKAIADLLFSTETDHSGNPKGIGLTMWRFNIGAGSAEQGDASGISSEWHRAECFQKTDDTYDWQKQKGQQWFLQAAHDRGVPYLLGFTISPPVQLTLNGIAHSDAGREELNIRPGAMKDFASFLVDVTEHFHKKGLNLDYISPVNEPQWGWESEKQEGSPATNADIFELTKLTSEGLHEKGLPSKVLIGEAGTAEFLSDIKNDDTRGRQVKAFWDKSSPYYLGNLTNVGRAISAHSYFTTWPVSKQLWVCEAARDAIEKTDPKLAFWQTEFCILESNPEIGGGWKRDLGMDTALYVARVIHNDITIANATHWAWWLAVSQADYKDGLIYIDHEDGKDQPDALKYDGKVLPSKLLWTMGNFSRFVRPGMVRVGVTHQETNTLMVSAYLDKKTHQLAVVLINSANEPQVVSLEDLKVHGGLFASYTTSDTKSLRKGAVRLDRIALPPRSVVTLVGVLERV